MRMAAEGTQQILDICKKLVGPDVDLSSWQNKINEEKSADDADLEGTEVGESVNLRSVDTQYYHYKRYQKGVLTIGCVGQPNVGKSSLVNAMMGKKVVSVSKTPGHTKYFQTIFLTSNVKLCDCPGLVFPSKVPKPLQVLIGSFPIAQLSVPFIAVKFLAERLNLVSILKIVHPDEEYDERYHKWSAIDICDGWAKKRGFLTAHTGRLDSYRAANNLLRMALDGKICLCLRPPHFTKRKKHWESHPEVKTVKWVQAKSSYEETAELHFFNQDEFSDEESLPDENDSEHEDDSEKDLGTFNKFATLDSDD